MPRPEGTKDNPHTPHPLPPPAREGLRRLLYGSNQHPWTKWDLDPG